ncbi:hypothetical protein [Novosphingobium pentaromativorans]|uniref:Uncharacterized protein n=1 Tax=Novosphingobium pentaromativorans US6-1 TaxID=1088721 RepID=G6ECD2_9SPHN|nr:hypothetical protein [Novosphingobium pentaromativorans]EHJ61067.1 hypothetical protein NSU_2003 [Novosphingobium pentaromativorans US6-1]
MEPTAGKIFGMIGGAVRLATQAALVPAPAGMPRWIAATGHFPVPGRRPVQAGR